MKSALAHLLTVSALFASYHITIQHENDSTSIPVFQSGKLYFEDGALLSTKGGIDIPLEDISRITFPIKAIDPIVQNSTIVENRAFLTKKGNALSLNLADLNDISESATFFVVNLQGRVLVKKEVLLAKGSTTIDLTTLHLATGVYTLVCTVGNRSVVEKLILK